MLDAFGRSTLWFPINLLWLPALGFIVLPLSFFMAFVMHASPTVVVWCLNADQIFKCVPAFLESNYGNWIRKLTRDE